MTVIWHLSIFVAVVIFAVDLQIVEFASSTDEGESEISPPNKPETEPDSTTPLTNVHRKPGHLVKDDHTSAFRFCPLHHHTVVAREEQKAGISVQKHRINSESDSELIKLNFDEVDAPKEKMFPDDITYEALGEYYIKSKKIIQLERQYDPTNEVDNLVITNWLTRNCTKLLVAALFFGDEYKMVEIDYLPALTKVILPAPWKLGGSKFELWNKENGQGKVVDFSDLDEDEIETIQYSFIPLDYLQASLAYTANVTDQSYTFPDRVMAGNSEVCKDSSVLWRMTYVSDARYLWTLMINYLVVVGSPRFEEIWMKTLFYLSTGYPGTAWALTQLELNTYPEEERNFYDQTLMDGKRYYNKAHRAKVLADYRNKYFALGLVGGGGLGGGATMGISTYAQYHNQFTYSPDMARVFIEGGWNLGTDVPRDTYSSWNVFGHETGHALGFSHQSSYCIRRDFSHVYVGAIVYSGMMHQHKLPIDYSNCEIRDPLWEAVYNKNTEAPLRSRPVCGNPHEWGIGRWPRHDYTVPYKDQPEFELYKAAHLAGKGYEWLVKKGKLPLEVAPPSPM
eukprot:GHVL01002188.1.p1 GENE.GHVL01002188.1~~GHVL01002188.1.p1  ORF type:complete len:565 (+),score=84.27 GHVL01002188.1:46-1740(+)